MQRIAPRQDVALMKGYHSPQVEVKVRLNTNESPYPVPLGWKQALAQQIEKIEFNRYPDRSALQLRSAIAQLHGVEANQVLCANGSNEILQSILLAFGGASRTALVFEPTYALHSHIAHITQTNVAIAQRDENFSIDLDSLAQEIQKAQPSVSFFCSPNNPTGMVDSPQVLELALKQNTGLTVVDEAYGQFSSFSVLSLLDEELPLVVVRTFSKTWSMAASRLGYMVAPSWVVQACESVMLPYHLDALKQQAGILALKFHDEMQQRVAELVDQRDLLFEKLKEFDLQIWPSEANFILFRPLKMSGPKLWEELLKRSILVRDCSSWPRLDNCLRVTVGTPQENDIFIQALQEVLNE